MQDEALHKCLLLFEDPALEALPQHVVPKGYLSLRGHFGKCVKAKARPLRGNPLEK